MKEEEKTVLDGDEVTKPYVCVRVVYKSPRFNDTDRLNGQEGKLVGTQSLDCGEVVSLVLFPNGSIHRFSPGDLAPCSP